MEVTAELKFARISPKKVQPLVGDLRKRTAAEVLAGLKYTRSKAGKMLYKLIASAVANALNNYNFKVDNLRIKSITATEGPRYKRYWLRSHGAADVRLKRMAHLKVILEEITPVSVAPKPKVAPPVAIKSSTPAATTPALSSTTKTEGAEKLPTGGGAAKQELTPKLKGRHGIKRLFTRTTNK